MTNYVGKGHQQCSFKKSINMHSVACQLSEEAGYPKEEFN